ncbi:hypothetical protein [Kribbella catacumbae]|uniref:hypothetical protein n=1 Tax=Kribbella catacumbae TaxID=460086 RepID=UPI00036193F0|nr:hypothetical protein [Kribbella catacumbae]
MSFSSSTRPSASGARGSGKAPVSGSNRLPASRERRPALAALAVILILLGAAGSALIALRSGDRTDYVAINPASIAPGHKIVKEDLARGDLAGKTGAMIPWADRDKVLNKYTTGWLFRGQYLTLANVTAEPIPAGGALVGVTLEAGRAPSMLLQGGDILQVVQVPAVNQAGGASSILVAAAKVMDVSGGISDAKTNANSTLNLTILVPTSKSTAVAAAAAAKTLVVVKLSESTPPDVPPAGGAG